MKASEITRACMAAFDAAELTDTTTGVMVNISGSPMPDDTTLEQALDCFTKAGWRVYWTRGNSSVRIRLDVT